MYSTPDPQKTRATALKVAAEVVNSLDLPVPHRAQEIARYTDCILTGKELNSEDSEEASLIALLNWINGVIHHLTVYITAATEAGSVERASEYKSELNAFRSVARWINDAMAGRTDRP